MATSVVTQLELKMILERRFKVAIRQIFALMKQDFRTMVASRGIPPAAARYFPAWDAALQTQYVRTQKLFTGVVGDAEKKEKSFNTKESFNTGELSTEDKELLALALFAWRDTRADLQAQIITDTNERNFSEALSMADQQAREDGEVLSNPERAVVATTILGRKFNGRTESIATTETQAAAEATKFTEVEVRSGVRPRSLGGGLVASAVSKKWTTVGDKLVRGAHQSANRQVQSLTVPFVVKNQFLMYPGDGSMGATVDNLANCRCITQYL